MSSQNHSHLNESDLYECKRMIFLESQVLNNQKSGQKKLLESSNFHKNSLNSEVNSGKKIKLKSHLKTEISNKQSPQKKQKMNLLLSPNFQSPMINKTSLQHRKLNFDKYQRRNKIAYSQLYTKNQFEKREDKHLSVFSEVPTLNKPISKYSRQKKASFIENSASKSQQRSISKKKINFTVYESKASKSDKKNSKYLNNRDKKYDIPYRYDSTITIDLFEKPESKNKILNSKSKSNSKSQSKDKQSTNSIFKRTPLRNLIKNDIENDQTVIRTLKKIEKFKFVMQFIKKWELLQMIHIYSSKNEPQCKWPLLIVDEVFKKMKRQNICESIV